MKTVPSSVSGAEPYPHKEAIVQALAAGARCKKLSPAVEAGLLAGTFQIRLRISKDPKTTAGHEKESMQLVAELEPMLERLKKDPKQAVVVFSIGPTATGMKYHLYENEQTGAYLGCLSGKRDLHEG